MSRPPSTSSTGSFAARSSAAPNPTLFGLTRRSAGPPSGLTPALCCNTGVCGPDLDQALVDFTADLNHLAGRGADINRHNLASYQPRRQDLARRGRGPGHGPYLRVRRRGPRVDAGPRVHACATARPSTRATSSPSTAPPGRSSPARCRSPTRRSCATSRATSIDDDELVAAVARLMAHADGVRRLRVRANADTPEDAARARRFGAQGIGLCRTEHMFLGERRELVERPDPGRGRRASGRRRWTRCCRCSARTSPRSSRRWTGCRSRSG